MKVCLNADMGESHGRFRVGNDAELMPLVSSANVACGMHAGDPTIMVETVRLAQRHDTSIGAHPGFNDLWGFGRRQIKMDPRDIEYFITYQIGALQVLAESQNAKVLHVKPHGALNNMAHCDLDIARAVARGIKAADRELIFVANCCSEMTRAGTELDLRLAHEAYADRIYDETGMMVSRTQDNAVINDADQAAEQVVRIMLDQAIWTGDGKRIPTRVDTFCIHGDEPTAVELGRKVRQSLEREGVTIAQISDVV